MRTVKILETYTPKFFSHAQLDTAISLIRTGVKQSATSTAAVLGDGSVRITGTGLKFDGTGHLSGGTVAQIQIRYFDGAAWKTAQTISSTDSGGLKLSGSAIAAADLSKEVQALFADWSIHLDGTHAKQPVGGSFNEFYGKTQADSLIGTGFSDRFDGGKGNDTLKGLAGDDALYGGSGSDKLYGGVDSDTLTGGSGNDRLDGGDGLDTAVFGVSSLDGSAAPATANLTIDLAKGTATGEGTDTLISIETVRSGSGDDTILGSKNDDEIFGGNGKDLIKGGNGGDNLHGQDGNDRISGDAGQDQLFGDAGNDKMWGGDGFDDIWGGDGNDTIYGGAAADDLVGEGGRDILYGGTGADEFIYSTIAESPTGSGRDIIKDFKDFGDADIIDIASLAGPVLSFVGKAAFTNLYQVRAIASGADVLVQINLEGDLKPDMEILLEATKLADVGVGDFLL